MKLIYAVVMNKLGIDGGMIPTGIITVIVQSVEVHAVIVWASSG